MSAHRLEYLAQLRLALPILGGQLAQTANGFVDTMMAGRVGAEDLAAVAVGGTVALLALVGGPLTGASMNPARTLGPALASGVFDGFWIYAVGPVVGAVAGAWTYQVVAWRPDLDRHRGRPLGDDGPPAL